MIHLTHFPEPEEEIFRRCRFCPREFLEGEMIKLVFNSELNPPEKSDYVCPCCGKKIKKIIERVLKN